MVREMSPHPSDIELPPAPERELRAHWLSSLSERERAELAHRTSACVERLFAAWRAQQELPQR
jgi:hypothetical protein